MPDSEGPGRQRGGLGLRRDYVVEGAVSFSVLADRGKFPPAGFAGGHDANVASFVRNPDTDPEFLPSKFSIRLAPGEVVRVEMAGGGGYGDPLERDPRLVLADVTEEKITVGRAREAYGSSSTGRACSTSMRPGTSAMRESHSPTGRSTAMVDPGRDGDLRAQAGALSAVLGIEQTPERASELMPALATFMAEVALLWRVDVTGCEMAVRFDVDNAW